MPKLSIITICYNEPNLEATCESIVNQTWQDFEWIVVDGGSNEETQKIWDKYKYRIDKFISEPDNGIYNACNKGIRIAEGEYIQFLNAGDAYYDIDVLKTIFMQNSYIEDVIYGEQNEIYDEPSKNHITKQPNVNTQFLITNCIQTSASFIRRELFNKYGLYNESYKIVSDYEHWIIFYQNGVTFKHIDTVVTNFDKQGISSNKQNQELHKKEREEVIKKYFTEEEIKISRKKYKDFSIIEQIFSITNSLARTHKVITILGIHIKIKRSKK